MAFSGKTYEMQIMSIYIKSVALGLYLDFGCDFSIGVCGNISVRWVMNGFIIIIFFQVKRMVVSTYQAASGAGAAAMRELELQTHEVSFYFIFLNVLVAHLGFIFQV